jgi:hypothetical protein
MNFAEVEKVAAAILYEGYILYPYRKTAIKNRQRWNFGTLYPRVYAEAQMPEEPFRFVAECLTEEGTQEPTLDLKIQFLQLLRQRNQASSEIADRIPRLSDPSLEWEEAIERTAECKAIRLDELAGRTLAFRLQLEASTSLDDQEIQKAPGVEAVLTLSLELLSTGVRKIRLELLNATPLSSGAKAKREEALPLSFVSAHALLGLHGGEFVSLLDPGERYAEVVKECRNAGVFPVLAGVEPDRTMMLCSPIILYDYPKIAPESKGDFFDSTEMDEMLTLRVLTLTDAEKQEMRDGDPRARRILERTESLTAETMMKTHGVIRSMREIRRDA